MFFTDDPLRVEFLDGSRWLLVEPFSYLDEAGLRGDGDAVRIEVPAGFSTDFASIPRGLWNLFPPTGRWGKAAVIHDWLYACGRVAGQDVSRAYADGVFRRAMADVGVGWLTRWTMYSAVRVGAGRVWSRYRKARELEATV